MDPAFAEPLQTCLALTLHDRDRQATQFAPPPIAAGHGGTIPETSTPTSVILLPPGKSELLSSSYRDIAPQPDAAIEDRPMHRESNCRNMPWNRMDGRTERMLLPEYSVVRTGKEERP